jgi:hypothetical protein
MALPFGETPGARDARALSILAKTIYRELRTSGFEARDVIALAGELLAHVTNEVAGGVASEGQAEGPASGVHRGAVSSLDAKRARRRA